MVINRGLSSKAKDGEAVVGLFGGISERVLDVVARLGSWVEELLQLFTNNFWFFILFFIFNLS